MPITIEVGTSSAGLSRENILLHLKHVSEMLADQNVPTAERWLLAPAWMAEMIDPNVKRRKGKGGRRNVRIP